MISLARLQAYLGVTGDTTYLTQAEAAAVADVERATGRYLGTAKAFEDILDVPVTTLRLVRGAGQAEEFPHVRISQPATLAALTISERGSVADEWEEIAKTSDGLQVFELAGRDLYRRIGAWPQGERTVKVAYSHGYAVDAAPAPFEVVVFDLVAERFVGAQARALGGQIQSASVQGNSVTFRGSESTPQGMSSGLWRRITRLRWED